MRRVLIAALYVLTLTFAACGEDTETPPPATEVDGSRCDHKTHQHHSDACKREHEERYGR